MQFIAYGLQLGITSSHQHFLVEFSNKCLFYQLCQSCCGQYYNTYKIYEIIVEIKIWGMLNYAEALRRACLHTNML